MEFLDLLGSVLTGGATGLLGVILKSVFGFFEEAQKEKQRQAEHRRTIDIIELNARVAQQEDDNEVRRIDMQTSADLRVASYQHDSQTGQASQWVVDLLRLVRPTLTGLLIILVTILWFTTEDKADTMEIVKSILYLASTAVTWWFGDRPRPRAQ